MLDTRTRILLVALGQLSLLALIDSWILRLQCIDQDAYNKFSVVHQGYALENSVIAVYERMDAEECKTMCIDEYRCRSINHSKDQNRCEINDKIKETSGSSNFKAKAGYSYLATSYSTRNIGPVCQELNPCLNATFCIDRCTSPGYKCIKCPKYHEIRYEQYCQLKDFVNRFYELKNLAVGKGTDQSSTYYQAVSWSSGYDLVSSYANDGDERCTASGRYILSSTKKDANPYWRIDLQRSAVVLNVTIKNRGGANGGWINPFDVRVGYTTTNGGRSNTICVAGARFSINGEMKNFTCPETEGRYVSIHLSRSQYLQLCEVQVYGIYL